METMRQDCDILSHQFCGQQGGGTSTQMVREIGKKKEYKKERSFIWMF